MAQIKLTKVRLSFNDLFAPQAYKEGKPSYRAKVLIEPGSANDKLIQAAIMEAATEKFGKKAAAIIEKHKTNNMKHCYVSGDLDNSDEHDGFMILAAKRAEIKGAPTVIDGKRQNLTPKDGKPYSGCYVNLIADIYAQTGDYEGIRCGLGGVQFHSDGDAFSGGSTPKADDFDEVDDGIGADNDLE